MHNALYKVGIDSEDLAMDMVRMILANTRMSSMKVRLANSVVRPWN